jgi:hypothetical protein
MIISIAVSFKAGNAIWVCCEDFESVEEGVLYATRRITERGFSLKRANTLVTTPLRATGLAMADGIERILRREAGL